jgi:hypothetical protein
MPGPDDDTRVLVGGVGVSVALTLGHGLSHASVPVAVPALQGGVAAVVLFGAPLATAVAALSGRRRAAAALALAAGLTGLVFEGSLHFLVANPDHVAVVGWSLHSFAVTAVLTTVGDAALALAGTVVLARQPQGSSATAAIDSTT